MLKDGLGNQLFEYAYAKKIQELCGDSTVKICTFLYALKNFSLNGTRHCSLQNYALSNDVEICKGIKNVFYFMNFMFRLLLTYKCDFFTWFIKRKRITRGLKYIEDCKKGIYLTMDAYEIPDFIPTKKKKKFIFGNYESANALPNEVEKLRDNLSTITTPNNENKKLLESINKTNSVCVHIRRGDYNNKGNEWLQVCDLRYYQKGIDVIKGMTNNPNFFVFSNTHDDIEWIKKNYDLGVCPIYVDMSNPDYEEFRLMSSCKHFIISNSTFSWWAAFLSRSENKVVIAPKRWNNKDPQELTASMYLETWIKV